MPLYPVNLDICGKLCLVVGGGVVALRKTRSLLAAGAAIRLVSPEIHPELVLLADNNEIEWFERGFAEGDLEGAFLVFGATDNSEIQRLIEEEAAEKSILLNSADDPRRSDFHVPAHFRRGRMLVTVATGGSSPALARKIRQNLEEEFVAEYEILVDLFGLIREKLVGQEGNSGENSQLFRTLLDEDIVELVLSGNWFDLQMMLLRELPESADAVGLLKKVLEKHDNEKD